VELKAGDQTAAREEKCEEDDRRVACGSPFHITLSKVEILTLRIRIKELVTIVTIPKVKVLYFSSPHSRLAILVRPCTMIY
jgi:hypothetical protein